MKYLECPLRPCLWRTVDRSHLGWVVVNQPGPDGQLDLVRQPAVDVMQRELLAHVASEHVEELQLMLAGASGGQGAPVTASVVQHIDARQVQDAADLVASILVPKMRGQLAQKLATEKLRPVDPWPAVQVRRFCWGERYLEVHPDAPGGMRPACEDEEPDLYQLELQTLAVPDRRTLEL
jgi:hypothetical protein